MPNQFDTEIVEPEERKNYEDAQFNPLDEAVNEKTYSRPNVNTSGSEFTKPIEEPRYAPPPMEKKKLYDDDPKKKEREPINPELRDLPKKDKEMAASQMAKMIIQGYSWMHDLANKGLMISEKKLNKLQEEGEINLQAMIDYEFGKKMRAGEFFTEWNTQIQKDGGVLQVSNEFKEEVTPALERVLAKRGIGMTDEQLVMFMFGKDIAAKGLIFFQMKTQMNYMIQSIKEATVNQYRPAPPPPPQQPQQPQQQQAQPEPSSNFSQAEEVKEPEVRSYFEKNTESIKPDVIVLPNKKRGRPRPNS
jgi:hypothetical protein